MQYGVNNLQEKLGYWFKNLDTLELALTHSSWASDLKKLEKQNERLEFLGDAVLELCVSTELFQRYPQAREGDLTQLRSQLVNEAALARLARKIGLAPLLKLGRGEEQQSGRDKDSVLSDAMEAVLAAVYLDGGFMAARQSVKILYKELWPETWERKQEADNKSKLQELSQNLFHGLPTYSLETSTGPAHAPTFEIALRLPDGRKFRASASSCKKAEQKAAGMALDVLLNVKQKGED